MNWIWLDDSLSDLDSRTLRRGLKARGSAAGGEIVLDGRPLIDFGSNDYLGLSDDPRIRQAARAAIDRWGWGSAASPLVSGRSELHAVLERELADFEGAESALLFPTGYAANIGVICSLVERGDVILSDAKNHASIIDGCRLSGAKVHIYRHADTHHLHELLRETNEARRRLVVTDGLFSMDGDVAPLDQIFSLCERHHAMLMVDEAHATGVLGSTGRGACELHGLRHADIVRVGTLSKALGSLGGFAVGSQQLIHWISNRARPYVFSTAAPPACCAAALAALRVVQEEPRRRTELLARADHLRSELANRGWSTGTSTTQIVPVIIGQAEKTMQFARQLQSRGLFVPGIRPPSVPAGESLLRISLSESHTDEMIDLLLRSLEA